MLAFGELVDIDPLDQGKQTKPVHVQERFGPREPIRLHRRDRSGKGAVEVGNDDDVPGVTG